jgi:tetratricopeptide (TPR) repeat protein
VPESVAVVAEASGTYRLEVRPLHKVAAGRYEIRIEELREATAQDKKRIVAERAVSEASHLYMQATVDSRRQAIRKLEEALPLWQAMGDRRGEAQTLNLIGAFHFELGESQKALTYCYQALPLLRAVGDRQGEMYSLRDIGVAYRNLSELPKVL